MAERVVNASPDGAELPEVIDRRVAYPSYTYELMFGRRR